MSKLVSQPPRVHSCNVTNGGTWFEWREPSPDGLFPLPAGRLVAHFIHTHDPAGTVRACEDCGKTWVSYRPHPMSGWAINIWRPESRFARWRRERALVSRT